MIISLSRGNCFICGAALPKQTFKNHLLTAHAYNGKDGQDCVLFQVEDTQRGNYWLFLDIPISSTLKTLDAFLRCIWLECCGHLSAFYTRNGEELSMGGKIEAVAALGSLRYNYDFGSTTALVLMPLGKVTRPKQQKAVRLLGRNAPFHYSCGQCGADADFICQRCLENGKISPMLCRSCMRKHKHEELLPVTNSPRMGVCCYCGETDHYEFDPKHYKK